MASLPLRRKARSLKNDDGVVSRTHATISNAQDVVSCISSRKVVRKLLLDHIELEKNGWIEVLACLRSLPASRSAIVEIDLRGCQLTDVHLLAISGLLSNNHTLKSLWLQNNCFEFSAAASEAFITAINSSRLEYLRLGTNTNHNAFASRLLEGLNTPYLQTLELSNMGLGSHTVPSIANFVSSTRCHLRALRLNANEFSLDDVKTIHSALFHNYYLLELEGHAINIKRREDWDKLSEYANYREELLVRNRLLQRQVAEDALRLLRHSRAVLLPSPTPPPFDTSAPRSPRKLLPPEIICLILSYFAPNLSPSQCIRIFDFASTRSTLPPLLPRLPVATCLPDPAAPPGPNGGCSENCCMGSAHYLSCRRKSEREEWLRDMHCDAFDPGR